MGAEESTRSQGRDGHLINPVMREEDEVTPLELFFDLVFVLALTQCTALMASSPTWEGIGQGLLVLAVLWWSWVGYAWLTSVIDPEEGPVRLAIFAAMAAFLVAALCVPEAFGDNGLLFAFAFAVVRSSQIALFLIASQDEPGLRKSVVGLAVSTALGVTLLILASFTDGTVQAALWGLALLIDVGGPYFFGASGWKLMPEHFAERHGLILIIALGESIVAIGVGAEHGINAGIVAAAVLGIIVSCAQWWIYFDVTVYAATRRLVETEDQQERNELARDAYSYTHFLMVAGIVLGALGLKKTIEDVGAELELETATALLGGAALYLLGHVAFRLRMHGSWSKRRLVVAIACLALIPLAVQIPAVATVAVLAALMVGLVIYEAVRFAESRDAIRSELARGTR